MQFYEALRYLLTPVHGNEPQGGYAIRQRTMPPGAWVQVVGGRDVPTPQIWSMRGQVIGTATGLVPVARSFTYFDGTKLHMGWTPDAGHCFGDDWEIVP